MVSYPGTITGNLSVSGNASVGGTLAVTGSTTLAAASATNLTVTGLATLGKVIETGDYFQLSTSPTFTLAAQTATPITLAVAANGTYLLDSAAIITNTTGNTAVSWTGPAGAVMQWNDTGASLDYAATIGATNTYASNAGTRMAFFRGLLVVAGTVGSLTMTLGVSAGTTTLAAGSWLRLTRVA